MCSVTWEHLNGDLVVESTTIELLEVGAETVCDSFGDCCKTCGIVLETTLATTVLHSNSSSERLIVFDANAVLVVTVVDLDCSLGDWWLGSGTGLACSALS